MAHGTGAIMDFARLRALFGEKLPADAGTELVLPDDFAYDWAEFPNSTSQMGMFNTPGDPIRLYKDEMSPDKWMETVKRAPVLGSHGAVDVQVGEPEILSRDITPEATVQVGEPTILSRKRFDKLGGLLK